VLVLATGCATTGLPQDIPADSPASPAAPAAPQAPVAQVLRSPDPLAWPPLGPPPAGGHHHHGGAAPSSAGDSAGHGASDHAGHTEAPATQPAPAGAR
jgi:hypothetical protein